MNYPTLHLGGRPCKKLLSRTDHLIRELQSYSTSTTDTSDDTKDTNTSRSICATKWLLYKGTLWHVALAVKNLTQ
jgi:hypothetical protein